jgi:multimeric flavodoxin WrbA
MKNLTIVYHSQSGTCARLAQAALQGAQLEQDVQVVLLRAADASVLDLVGSDGVLLIAAENSGALAGGMKDFLDRVFYPAIRRELVLPYGLIISAGNDGRGAERETERILSGIPFTRACATQILRGEFDQEKAVLCQESGQALAAGLALGIF